MLARFVAILIGLLIAFSVGFSLLASSGGVDSSSGLWVWVKFYREGLRTPLFTGFLTLGSFLLTLKATILLRIKEIYDEEKYEKDWLAYQEQRKRSDPNAPVSDYYAPLRRLGEALLANVVLAITSSIAQITLGFVNAPWALGICLGFAATTLLLLLFLWFQIAANLVRWFSVIEEKKREKLKQ